MEMNTLLIEMSKLGISLLSILNPLGAIPTFISLTKNYSESEIKKISTSCSVAVVVTILTGLVFGDKILNFFGIGLSSFRIGGGILIGSMAFGMLKAEQSGVKMGKDEIAHYNEASQIGIVPLAIPLLAGPGTISTSIINAEHFVGIWHWVGAVIVSIFLGIIIKIILNFARPIGKKMGTIGLNVMTRIMGLILMAVAVEFVVGGIKTLFNIKF